jgi:hypothetical protein
LIGDTGAASGKAFCNTPFDLFWSDAEPELGVDDAGKQFWTIAREWTIRPVYADCTAGVPRGNPLRTDKVQNIIVRDVTAAYYSDVLETGIAQQPPSAAMVTYAIKDKIDLDKMTDTEMGRSKPTLRIKSLHCFRASKQPT